MKEFIDKLISRLEEEKEHYGTLVVVGEDDLVLNYNLGKMHSCENAISIVNELAEEYKLFGNSEQVNDGWIPCSEKTVPEENGKYLVTVKTTWEDGRKSYVVFLLRFEKEDGWYIVLGSNSKIIAWKQIAPYTEGE